MRLPTWKDLERFCKIDAWERREGDHIRFRKQLDNGGILRTKVSRKGSETIGRDLWTHIWREQLALDNEEDFWRALDSRRPVVRKPAETAERPEGASLPGWLWQRLVEDVGLSEDVIRELKEDEALVRLHQFWSRPAEE